MHITAAHGPGAREVRVDGGGIGDPELEDITTLVAVACHLHLQSSARSVAAGRSILDCINHGALQTAPVQSLVVHVVAPCVWRATSGQIKASTLTSVAVLMAPG